VVQRDNVIEPQVSLEFSLAMFLLARETRDGRLRRGHFFHHASPFSFICGIPTGTTNISEE
jgi:hypothetical protein